MQGRHLWEGALACAIVGVMACATTPSASARQRPAEITPVFKDRGVPQAIDLPKGQNCAVQIVAMRDDRMEKALVGIIGTRAVKSPLDSATWLKSVLSGLEARNIKVAFDAPAAPSATALSFALKTAWIDASPSTYSANVVAHVTHGDGAEKIYRGRSSRTAYWSGGEDTLQSALNGAFADLLDKLTLDLGAICRS